MKTPNVQCSTANIQLRSGEIDPATFVWFFVEPDKGYGDNKKNGAATIFKFAA
jgi:hypothetical protein